MLLITINKKYPIQITVYIFLSRLAFLSYTLPIDKVQWLASVMLYNENKANNPYGTLTLKISRHRPALPLSRVRRYCGKVIAIRSWS